MTLSALTDYDEQMLTELAATAGGLLSHFAEAGFVRVEPPMIEPADVFLDRSGEEIRRRTFIFSDPAGAELALRPDLTIPVCRHYVRAGGDRLSYSGTAFRVPRAGAEAQFTETGIEWFGEADKPRADAEVLALTLNALQAAGLGAAPVTMGDIGLFHAFVDTLDMPERWRARMKRRFWQPSEFATLIDNLAEDGTPIPQSGAQAGGGFVAALAALDDVEARRAAVSDLLALADVKPAGGRSAEDIAERLLDQAEDRAADALSPAIVERIHAFMAINGPITEALDQLKALETGAKDSFAYAVRDVTARLDALEARGVEPGAISFASTFGRQMDYYTGFVFEVRLDGLGPLGQIAGGGRYDRLIGDLGGDDVPAVGAMIRPERLIRALKGGA